MKKIKFKKGDIVCHDCERKMNKGDDVVVYDLDQCGVFYKCKDCYAESRVLENFQKCEVYSRIVGYIRPVQQWNVGKTEEYKDRKEFVCDGC